MIELLAKYSLLEIVIFLVTFALAIKGLVTFWDWAIDRLRKAFNKQSQRDKEKQILEERLLLGSQKMRELAEQDEKINKAIEEISNNVNMLVKSDKDAIKAFITNEHHKFCYQEKWIDDYSLDCVERRFVHYKDEGGNSFIKELMNDLRNLPKQPPNE